MLGLDSDLYAAIAELDTTIRALDIMTRNGDDDAQIILRHMANHLRPIHEKLTDEFDKLENQRLKAV
jgi:phosphoribosylamine-glycine ligase